MNDTITCAAWSLGIAAVTAEQERALEPILQGRDTFVSLRTGGGKSMVYQLPVLLDGPGELTLVFSPLRALQSDQVGALRRKGVRAGLLNSDLSKREQAVTLADFCANGGFCTSRPSS